MALYLIAFNDEWVPDHTLEELREKARSARAVIEEMTDAGVFVFSDGGLDASTVVCSVDPSSRIAVAVGWPQEVHRFPHRTAVSLDPQSESLA